MAQPENKTVTVGERSFVIGSVPRGMWRNMMMKSADSTRRATRRALMKLQAEGAEPTEDAVRTERQYDTQYLDDIDAVQREVVQWALREIVGQPFEPERVTWLGQSYVLAPAAVVAELSDYDDDLFSALHHEVIEFNALSPSAKKKSPPASSTEPESSGATIA